MPTPLLIFLIWLAVDALLIFGWSKFSSGGRGQ